MGKRKEITGKDNGKQKMWTIITVIIVFFAMAGYAGMESKKPTVPLLERKRKKMSETKKN